MKDAAYPSCRRFYGHSDRAIHKMRGAFLCLLSVLAALALSGCATGGGIKSALRGETPAARPAPPRPKGPTPMDTFRAMAQPAGIKLTPLFLDTLPEGEERFKRVEDAVQELRDDFDTVVPTLVRLAAVEKDMKDLVGQLKALTEDGTPRPVATAPPAAAKPEYAPTYTTPPIRLAPEPEPAPAPSPQAGAEMQAQTAVAAAPSPAPETQASAPVATPPKAPSVQAIRIGEHPGMTRVVLDLDGKTSFDIELQKNGRKLAVTLAGVKWDAKPVWAADKGNLVSGYRYEEGGKLTLDLISPSKILSQDVIAGEKGKGFRIVIDLAARSAS